MTKCKIFKYKSPLVYKNLFLFGKIAIELNPNNLQAKCIIDRWGVILEHFNVCIILLKD